MADTVRYASTVRYARILSQNYGTLVRYVLKEYVAVRYGGIE